MSPLTLPHVIGGALECWPEGLSCRRQSVRDGEVSLCPVFVLHYWSQILVHVIHSQHRHLREEESELKSHCMFLVVTTKGNAWRTKTPEYFCQSAGWFQNHRHPRQMDWWSALPPTKEKPDWHTGSELLILYIHASAPFYSCSCSHPVNFSVQQFPAEFNL